MSAPVIDVRNVSKEYRRGQIGGTTLREEALTWLRAKTGQDPSAASLSANERFWALDDISFSVEKGDRLGIIGRNGAGKSTLLKLISRITAPTRGQIDVYGRVFSMLEVGSGFHGEMTGRENIYLNGTILGMTKAEIDRRIDEIIEFSEIGPFIDTPVKRYSSGMYVKLAFSVAAHLRSEIMILDEVLSVGDVLFRRKCLAHLEKEAMESGRTVLYVSHNMNTIRQLCTRCLVLDGGKLIYDGDPEKAISLYAGTDAEMKSETDLSAFPRTSIQWKHTARLLYAAFANIPDPGNVDSDTVKVLLRWENRSAERLISLRAELWTEEAPQGSYILSDLAMRPVPEETVYEVTLDIRELVPAEYKIKFTLFFRDAAGQSLNADSVTALYFRRTGSFVWDNAHWGHFRLESAEALRIQ